MSDACCSSPNVVNHNYSDIHESTMKKVKNILNGSGNMAVISAGLNMQASDSGS